MAAPLGLLLPLAELATAALLVPASSAWWGALSALALLLAFAAAIGVNLAQGRKPDCHCFGQLHAEPAGWRTLARNVGLAALAAFVVWQGAGDAGPSAVAWLLDLTPWQAFAVGAGTAAAAVIVAQGWFLLQLFHQHGRLLMRVDALEEALAGAGVVAPAPLPRPSHVAPTMGLPLGTPAPPFRLPALAGEPLALDDLRAPGRPVLLAFVDPHCGPCTALVPNLARWQDQHREALTFALVSRGAPDENRAKVGGEVGMPVFLQEDREVAEAYRAHGTPGAVVVRPDGTVGSPVAIGAEAIGRLVARTVAALEGDTAGRPAAARPGDPAPVLSLPDLDGQDVAFEEFRGRSTLVLFWNPGCGHCARMLPDLQRWDAAPPEGAPGLVVVSGGSVEANRAMGLRAPVLLDQAFAAGRTFGASGTPSAVLVDVEGRIASPVAVGATQVWALLGTQPPDAVAA